jgi:hypothetical protein
MTSDSLLDAELVCSGGVELTLRLAGTLWRITK